MLIVLGWRSKKETREYREINLCFLINLYMRLGLYCIKTSDFLRWLWGRMWWRFCLEGGCWRGSRACTRCALKFSTPPPLHCGTSITTTTTRFRNISGSVDCFIFEYGIIIHKGFGITVNLIDYLTPVFTNVKALEKFVILFIKTLDQKCFQVRQ